MMGISEQSREPVRLEYIGEGPEVTPRTMEKMKQIINNSIREYYVRRWAEKITEQADYGDIGKVEAIYWFLARHTRYLKDPYGLEMLKTPRVSLKLIEMQETPGLDCDDLAILSLSLLKSVGLPVALRATSYRPDKKFTHVYGLVRTGGRWVPIDLVKTMGVGWEAPGKTNVKDMEV